MLTESLRGHIESLSEPRNPTLHIPAHRRARDYLCSVLSERGRSYQLQTFESGSGVEGVNIFSGSAQAPILLVAHYDTVDHSPGADDNGSAVAVALEVAARCPHVAVLLPDLEEQDLLGSRHFVKAGDHWRGACALVLESVGYWSSTPDSQDYPVPLQALFPEQFKELQEQEFRGNFWALLHQTAQTEQANQLRRSLGARCLDFCLPDNALKLQAGTLLSDFGRSDHLAFWEAGLPCLMLTDTANFRNPNYHQPSDTIDTLNFEEMARLVEDIAAWVSSPQTA